jgi:acetylornithine aminotransferase
MRTGNDIHSSAASTNIAAVPARFTSTSEVLDGYAGRSWRFLAELQRSSGMEFVIGEAEGPYLWNVEHNHRLLDCGNSGGVHSLGHRNAELLATMRAALDHHDAGIWTMPSAEALALHDALAAFAPVPSINRSVMTLSATDSIDLAIMFAFRFTGRRKILAYRYGYHGHGGYAALVTGSDAEGVLDHYSLPRSQSCFFQDYDSIESIRSALNEDCAAIILEPMNFETFKPASAAFLPELAALCRQSGTLLIIDETRTGLSRSGLPWMSSHYDVAPDMLILGKGLGGGLYPISALLTTEAIYDRCMNDGHWGFMSSMAGSAIGSLVAAKVVEIVQRKELLENVARLERALTRQFTALSERFPTVFAPGWVLGGIAAIGLRDESAARAIRSELFKRGVMCHSVSEIEPRMVKFFPCLTSDMHVVDEMAEALSDIAASLLRTQLTARSKAV